MLNWKQVEEQMVAAVRLYWRSGSAGALPAPGSGRRGGFATDAPWNLLTRQVRAGSAMEAWRQEQDEAIERRRSGELRTVPLTAEEVDWMEERLAWLLLVPDANRKLVELAVKAMAASGGTIDWARVRSKLPVEVSRVGLYRRFVRSLQALAREISVRGEAGQQPASRSAA